MSQKGQTLVIEGRDTPFLHQPRGDQDDTKGMKEMWATVVATGILHGRIQRAMATRTMEIDKQ
jgi:hypothetical protein